MGNTKKRVYPNLKAYLEDLARQGVDQGDFAAQFGISEGYLSDLKNGHVSPSLKLAAKLSEAAGVPIESFLLAPTDS
jgi:transcriptional regulator with XRE-family HTH domain